MDYPFTTWTTYYTAYTEFLKGDYYVKVYPKYARYQEDTPWSEVKIVEELLDSGQNPQEGLDRYVQALLEGLMYDEFEMKENLPKIVKLFMDVGAKPNVDVLFTLKYPQAINEQKHTDNPNIVFFKDEVCVKYAVRGRLIDEFSKYGIDVSKYYDWTSIKEKYWLDIDETTIKEDYQKACFMALKYHSAVLYSL